MKTENNTGLSSALELDSTTLELLQEIRRRKQEISRIGRPSYRTNLSFCPQEQQQNSAVNLNTLQDVRQLLLIAGQLIGYEEHYNRAASRLAVSCPPFSWQGYSLSDWLHDIELRIGKLQIGQQQEKLRKLEERANAIISPELRRQLEIQAIQQELSS